MGNAHQKVAFSFLASRIIEVGDMACSIARCCWKGPHSRACTDGQL